MIGYFLSYDDSAVVIDVFRTFVGYFKYLTRTMMSSGFWNYLRMYCFIFLMNFLYWSLAYLCADMVLIPRQNTPLLPLSSWLMMCILGHWSVRLFPYVLGYFLLWYDLIGRVPVPCCLNLIRLSQRHGWLLLHCRSCPFFLWQMKKFLFPESLYFTLSFWILLKSHSYPCSVRDITPCVRSF